MKCVIVGEAGVGKTSILLRYVDGTFSDKTLTPAQIAEKTQDKKKKFKLEGNEIEISFMDTLGQEVFRQLTGGHYRGANIVVLVFDITDQTSYDNLDNWIKAVDRSAQDSLLFLVGNKTDVDDRVVSTEQAEGYAKERNLKGYMETSALDGSNIEQLFIDIVEKFIENEKDKNS